ncbi:MAG: hypothetical protein IPK26_04950 [Planctomycetes bacterium]|nr:hypothetical protein [Planctomycetota bacterium]
MKQRIEKPRHRPYDRVDQKRTTALMVRDDLTLPAAPPPGSADHEGLAGGLFAVSATEWAHWQQAHRGGEA